jgi:hypothetical protein
MEKSVADSQSSVDVQGNQPLADVAWHVAADITAQHYMRNTKDIRSDIFNKDEEEEKEKKSCPTGGCPPDTKLNKDIWDDMMETTAKKNNLDLTNPEHKKNVHLEILPLFRQRFRENKRYEKQDKEGPEFAEGPVFVVQGSDIYFPAFNKTLRQMREDQHRIRPDLVDSVADRTMEIMEAAFASGATYARHVSHNKIDGKEAIRDEITMRIDSTGKGRMEIRNIGNNLSLKEAYDVMKKNGDAFIEGHPREGIFIFTDAPIESEVVHQILDQASQSSEDNRQAQDFSVKPIADHLSHGVESIEDGLSEEIDGWLRKIEDRYIKDIQIPPYLQRLLNTPQNVVEQELSIVPKETPLSEILLDSKNNSIIRVLSETPDNSIPEKDFVIAWRKLAEKKLDITPKQSGRMLEDLQETFDKMHDANEVLKFVVDTDIAIAAGIFALETLTMCDEFHENTLFISEIARKSESEMDIGSLEFIVQLSEEEKDQLFSIILQPDFIDHIDDVKKIFPEGIDVDVLIQTFRFITRIDTLPSDKKEAIIVGEKEKTLHEMSALWETIVKMNHHNQAKEMQYNTIEGIHSPHELISVPQTQELLEKSEKESVENFSLTLMIWMLLKVSSYYSNLEFIHKVIASQKTDSLHELVREENPERLIQKEPAPWLLLSIIWQMAMIREQGIAQQNNQNTNGKKQKKQKNTSIQKLPYFPDSGVIFAFSS